MIEIKVKLYGIQRDSAGKSSISLQEETGVRLKDILHDLEEKYGEPFHKLLDSDSGTLILVNGEPVRDPDTIIKGGSEISLLPALSGGR
jgi:MoaD family protein